MPPLVGLLLSRFNPHFRKGSDGNPGVGGWAYVVSIHTSAREVTPLGSTLCRLLTVSIHTSAREVTVFVPWSCALNLVSIHTSAREVTSSVSQIFQQIKVSIHTSAREVTVTLVLQSVRQFVSIHTSAREVTDECRYILQVTLVSIHTSAREVTFINCKTIRSNICFNPHFRKGSDSNISQKTFPVFMKHYQIHLNLLPHIPSNILSMQKHTQICLFFLVRVVR